MKLSNFVFFVQLAVHHWNTHKESCNSNTLARLVKRADSEMRPLQPEPVATATVNADGQVSNVLASLPLLAQGSPLLAQHNQSLARSAAPLLPVAARYSACTR